MATPETSPHPSVVAAQISLPSCRIIQLHVPNADTMAAIQFAQSLARVLEDGNTPVVVMREGWEILFTDLEE